MTARLVPHVAHRAFDLLTTAAHHGWAVAWRPGVDTGGNEYVTIQARHPDGTELIVTWHTRHRDGGAGNPRLFSALHKQWGGRTRDITLQEANRIITQSTDSVAGEELTT